MDLLFGPEGVLLMRHRKFVFALLVACWLMPQAVNGQMSRKSAKSALSNVQKVPTISDTAVPSPANNDSDCVYFFSNSPQKNTTFSTAQKALINTCIDALDGETPNFRPGDDLAANIQKLKTDNKLGVNASKDDLDELLVKRHFQIRE